MPYTQRIRRTERQVPPDSLDALRKEELVEVAKAQNIDSSGTKAAILKRLRNPS